jgi:plasmid stabilization system protein ParE
MKHYVVILEDSAQVDVLESYEWGCRAWGKREAQQWARQLRTAIFKQLGLLPKGFPLSPEDDEFSEEIRQMVVGRYRVLFTIKARKVHVLHVRGSYVRMIDQLDDDL